MATHVVLGAGPIGRTVAELLLADGHQVRVVTRSGTAVAGAQAIAMAADDPALAEALTGAASVIVATNPPYHRWDREWPPVLEGVIAAATQTGTDVVLIGNLYAHPKGSSPMTAATPLQPGTRNGTVRAQLWQTLLAAHQSGAIRAAEVRASDYIGPETVGTQAAVARTLPDLVAGKTVRVIGNPDAVHSWAAVADIARTAVAVATREDTWGRAWVIPTAEARSMRQVVTDLAQAAGLPTPKVSGIPKVVLRGVGVVNPVVREIVAMTYQFEAPFISDGSETTELLGVSATNWDEVIVGTARAAQLAGNSSPGNS